MTTFALLALAVAPACSSESTSRPANVIAEGSALRARISTCLGDDIGAAAAAFGPEELGGVSDTTLSCLSATSDCAGVLACFGWSRDSCAGDDACEGSTALHCRSLQNGIRVRIPENCALDAEGNRTCAVIDDGKSVVARCNAGQCSGDRCEGDVRIQCFGGVEVREDCSLRGRICVSTGADALCALPERCERDHCEGNTAIACGDDYVYLRLDCADVVASGQCRSGGCLAERWHPKCPAGEPYASFCDGNRALACDVGALYETRCDEFLAGHCEPGARGVGARCRSAQWP